MLHKFALALLFFCLPALAQDARGRITGRLLDPSGAAVPGVEVSATNSETNVKVTVTTNDAGRYDIPYLQPGIYVLMASAPGFKGYERKDLQVRVGDQLLIDILLEVGQVSESVTVSGQFPCWKPRRAVWAGSSTANASSISRFQVATLFRSPGWRRAS